MDLGHSFEGIRLNAVCPTWAAWVHTPLLGVELKMNPEVQDMILAIVPIQRAGECEKVFDTIEFLSSPAASYINDTSLLVAAAITTTVRLF